MKKLMFLIMLTFILCPQSFALNSEDAEIDQEFATAIDFLNRPQIDLLREDSSLSENVDPEDSKKSLMDKGFTLTTDEDMARESLDRISGKIDLGFSSPGSTYESSSHALAGPFSKEKINSQQ